MYVQSLTVLGYPTGTVPLGVLDHNGRPFGLAIIAKTGLEDLILAFMSAFKPVSKERPVPPQLVARQAIPPSFTGALAKNVLQSWL